jgi:hypothetical protein
MMYPTPATGRTLSVLPKSSSIVSLPVHKQTLLRIHGKRNPVNVPKYLHVEKATLSPSISHKAYTTREYAGHYINRNCEKIGWCRLETWYLGRINWEGTRGERHSVPSYDKRQYWKWKKLRTQRTWFIILGRKSENAQSGMSLPTYTITCHKVGLF